MCSIVHSTSFHIWSDFSVAITEQCTDEDRYWTLNKWAGIWRLLCLQCSEQYKSRRTTWTILFQLTKCGQVYELPLHASHINGIIQETQKHKVWKIHHPRKRPTFLPVASKVLLCVIPHHRVKIGMHTIMSLPSGGKWYANRGKILMAVWSTLAQYSIFSDSDSVCYLSHCWKHITGNLGDHSED
jgi:hypothetical protein